MKLDLSMLKNLIRSIVTTQENEIGCEDCYEELDIFAEMVLQGKDPDTAMPLVKDHLKRCHNCHEEFNALLDALHAIES